MIYTVTLNPSLDYIVSVDQLTLGQVNRSTQERIQPGGKGLNVSIMLHNLGWDSIALGFVAGFSGQEILRLLEQRGIRCDFIPSQQGLSRINVKLRSQQETEINGMGPAISLQEQQALFRRLNSIKEGDVLVLAGSIPSTMPRSIYCDIMDYLKQKNLRIVIDATKEALEQALPYRPFLIKPNHHELGELFGVTLNTRDEVIPYAKQLQQRGARNVLISMAGEGAVLLTEEGQIIQSPAPRGRVKNSVGAGDSMVAGFLAGYLRSQDYQQAFYWGICTGSASAFSEEFATKEQVENLLQNEYAR